MNNSTLLKQIAHIAKLPPTLVASMAREVITISEEWTAEYSEYQNGGWWTLSLVNVTGKARDTIIRDGVGQATELLAKIPSLKQFIDELGLDYFSVRLAKLDPGGFLWEHRDYQELSARPKLRLHVPLITDKQAALIFPGVRVHIPTGYIWKLSPIYRHAACNFGLRPRIHLLIDCYVTPLLKDMLAEQSLDGAVISSLPTGKNESLKTEVEEAIKLMSLGFSSAAELKILKLFHSYGMEDGVPYSLLSEIYNSHMCSEKANEWLLKRERFLGQYLENEA